jgi:hypothetical protein
MHLKLKRIAPLQAGKILAAIYGLFSLIMVPFILMFTVVSSFAAQQAGGSGGPPLPFMFGMGLGFMVLMPVFYAVMGFLGGVLGAAIYNLIAKWIGGFEFEFESATPQPPQL